MRARIPASIVVGTLLLATSTPPALADDGGDPRSFFRKLGDDVEAQARYPFDLAQDRPAVFLAGIGGIALLVGTDPTSKDWLTPDPADGSTLRGYAQDYSNALLPITAVTVAAFGAAALVSDNRREKDTTEFLVRTLVTANAWTEAFKFMTGRQRPRETAGGHSDWTGPGGIFGARDDGGNYRSFPSGHSTTAWAIATVVAHQYPSHHIVPILAYTSAAAMSYSRMVVEAHWLSDVVVGALIGYGCANEVTRSGRERASSAGSASVTLSRGWRLQVDMQDDYRGIGLAVNW
jgi:membrane-associated phospholipid phosphatase